MMFSLLRHATVVSVLLAGAQWMCTAQSPEKEGSNQAKPSETSGEPPKSEVKKDVEWEEGVQRLKKWEQDLFKPSQLFGPANSLDPVVPREMRVPTQSPEQRRRAREMEERRKAWMFMTAEDLAAGPSDEEIFELPEYNEDGIDKQEESAMDRFYRRLERRDKEGKDGKDGKDGKERKRDSRSAEKRKQIPGYDERRSNDQRDPNSQQEEEEMPSLKGVRDSEQALIKMFDPKKGGNLLAPLSAPNRLSDLFSGTKAPAPEQTPGHKARMEEFKQLMAPSSSSSSLQPVSSFGGPNAGVADVYRINSPTPAPSLAPPPVRPPLMDAGFGAAPAMGPAGFSDFGPKSVGVGVLPSFPSVTPIRTEPVKMPGAPTFVGPQRKF